MRRFGFTTLIDPLDARFGARWAAVLFLPALAGELFWSAELLVAIGATFGVLLEMPLTTAIAAGGRRDDGLHDGRRHVVGGLHGHRAARPSSCSASAVAMPYVLDAVGRPRRRLAAYAAARPDVARRATATRTADGRVAAAARCCGWWDTLPDAGARRHPVELRTSSACCRAARRATPPRHSVLAGLLTIALTVPPLLMGIGAFAYPWPPDLAARLGRSPADAMPLLFAHAVPPLVGLLGLAAIIGAVTSSFSSSILSAGSMLSWNCVKRLIWPSLSVAAMRRVIRGSILLFGALAAVLALRVQSVQALWFFTSDLVFVLLFPQLTSALFDPKANRTGSVAAFAVSAVLRLGGGEPLLGVPALLAYPDGFPFRTVAAAAGLILLPVVSRLTARHDPPRPLRNPAGDPPLAPY